MYFENKLIFRFSKKDVAKQIFYDFSNSLSYNSLVINGECFNTNKAKKDLVKKEFYECTLIPTENIDGKFVFKVRITSDWDLYEEVLFMKEEIIKLDSFFEIEYYFFSERDQVRGFVDNSCVLNKERVCDLYRVAYRGLHFSTIDILFNNKIAFFEGLSDKGVFLLNRDIETIECSNKDFTLKIKGELWSNFSNVSENIKLIKYNNQFYIDDWNRLELNYWE
jgi:hypothetical protein